MNQISGLCTICDASVPGGPSVEVSEILVCPDCKSRMVVESINGSVLMLEQAPEVEEDWGE